MEIFELCSKKNLINDDEDNTKHLCPLIVSVLVDLIEGQEEI